MQNLIGHLRRARDVLSGRAARDEADRRIAEGNRLEQQSRLEDACAEYRAAIAAAPRHARAHMNLGIALQAKRDLPGARAAYEEALRLAPGDPFALYNFANLLVTLGEFARAPELLRRALEAKPDFTDARVILAHVCDSQGRTAEAAAELETALRHDPRHAGVWYNYADLLIKLERRTEAEVAAGRASELDPTALPALQLWANLLRSVGQIDKALQVLGDARKLAPQRFDLESLELFTLNLSDTVSEEELSARHRAFGARLEQTVPPRFLPLGNARDPARRLRVGYVSDDLYTHPVAWFLLPILERQDRSAFELFCYSTNARHDEVTQQVRERTDVWVAAHGLSDDALAERVHADRIDILVDLTGHAGVTRLGMFAQQPAPVQATWLGYLNTTGLTRMHYRLCDAYTDPPGVTERLHTETLVRLPHSQWCYRPVADFPMASEPPCLHNGFVTFGSFNHAPKLSTTVCRLWIEILRRMPTARLHIAGLSEGTARERILRDFAGGGIDLRRLTIVPRVALGEYFRQFNAVDIALDSTPYSGGTTTCDTLWMGVPVVTAPGNRSVSRSAASILTTVGLTSWIASSQDEYASLAIDFARDPARLADLRRGLRQRIERSPIMDERQFTRDLEALYRRLWQAWCRGAIAH